ncbi:MAG: ribosome-associated translation inhibitor RaiA [Dehalococcoidia bacterium]|nr:ribosome-associated translation inhibitor RaiA [Dehalococcoidia bacterium]
MKLQIVTRNDAGVSETMREYASKKISKLDRYLPTIGEGKVEIFEERTKLPEKRFAVQVTLDSKGTLIRAQERAEDLRTAIDRVMDALTSRIERYKGKLYDKGRGISLARQEAVEETEGVEAPKKVVKSKHFLVKPMPEDEAINQMELLGHDFFLFINADTGMVNLLYRRKDGNYGLIVPEVG